MFKKKILATLLICVLIPHTTLFAKENTSYDSNERVIISSEFYDTITCKEDLIELAVNQSKKNESTNYTLRNSLDAVNEANTVSDILATQVEAERIYSDGSIEKDIRVDGFILTDANTNTVLTSNTFDSSLPKSTTSYGVSAYHTAYFTIKGESGTYTIQPRYVISSVSYSTVKVTNFVHGIFCDTLDKYAQDARQTIGVPAVNQNYYLYATNTSFYPNNTLTDLYTYMNISLSNGTSLYLEVNLTGVIKGI